MAVSNNISRIVQYHVDFILTSYWKIINWDFRI